MYRFSLSIIKMSTPINSNMNAAGLFTRNSLAAPGPKEARYAELKRTLNPRLIEAIDNTTYIFSQLRLLITLPASVHRNVMEKFRDLVNQMIDTDVSISPRTKEELKAYCIFWLNYHAMGHATAEQAITVPGHIKEAIKLIVETYKAMGGVDASMMDLPAMVAAQVDMNTEHASRALMSRMPAPGRGALNFGEPAAGPARSAAAAPAPARSSILPLGVRWNDRHDPRAKELNATQIAVAALVEAHKAKHAPTKAEQLAMKKEFDQLQQRLEFERIEREHAEMAAKAKGNARKGGNRCAKKPYSLNTRKVARSPFRTINTARKAKKRYTRKQPIGFTATSSLKSMGVIPRASGCYELGAKYIN